QPLQLQQRPLPAPDPMPFQSETLRLLPLAPSASARAHPIHTGSRLSICLLEDTVDLELVVIAVTPTTTNVRTGLIVRATPELGTASPRVGRARVGAQIAGGIRNFTGDARREAPERETANKQYRQRTKRPIGFLHHFLRMAREL